MLNKVKLALRVSTNLLDSEISDAIATARAELIRAGVPTDVVAEEGDLVQMAIKTYCLAVLTGDLNAQDKYFESFRYQEDCISKSSV